MNINFEVLPKIISITDTKISGHTESLAVNISVDNTRIIQAIIVNDVRPGYSIVSSSLDDDSIVFDRSTKSNDEIITTVNSTVMHTISESDILANCDLSSPQLTHTKVSSVLINNMIIDFVNRFNAFIANKKENAGMDSAAE